MELWNSWKWLRSRKIPSGPHDLSKSVGKEKDKISIDVPAGATEGTIKVAGEIKTPEVVDTKKVELEEMQVSTIGMYIKYIRNKIYKTYYRFKCFDSNKESWFDYRSWSNSKYNI